jgi:hypothetical protein
MSRQAYNEFFEFSINLDQLRGEYNEEQSDVWTCNWSRGLYAASKFYKRSFQDIQAQPPFLWIWQGKCMPKLKFFAWLLLVDRLNTRDVPRRRKNI